MTLWSRFRLLKRVNFCGKFYPLFLLIKQSLLDKIEVFSYLTAKKLIISAKFETDLDNEILRDVTSSKSSQLLNAIILLAISYGLYDYLMGIFGMVDLSQSDYLDAVLDVAQKVFSQKGSIIQKRYRMNQQYLSGQFQVQNLYVDNTLDIIRMMSTSNSISMVKISYFQRFGIIR